MEIRNSTILWLLAAALAVSGCGITQAAEPAPTQGVEVVRLWPGAAPGTESWTGPEEEVDAELPVAGKVHIVTNVTVPTLTVFRPRPDRANKTAIVVLPGGSFRALAWDLDGTETARWLAERGVTAFVLKYRVRPPTGQGSGGPESFDAFVKRTEPARQLAMADAVQALRLIRGNADKYGVAADRVGMIGFSAGAIAVLGLALEPGAAPKPDFAISLYGALPTEEAPGPGAPPVFVAAAQDDPQVPWQKSVAIYERWSRAGLPAEIHLYQKGGHGFGMRPHDLPADKWPLALEAWLSSRSLLGTPRAGEAKPPARQAPR
jgi:acetyl esterase/lipase